MQSIPVGNFQSRWLGCPRETGWLYQRAAASDSAGHASEQPEQRNSIQMELEGGPTPGAAGAFSRSCPGSLLPPQARG